MRNREDLKEEYATKLETLLQQYPQFREPYELKEDFREIYRIEDDAERAEELYDEWIERASVYPQFSPVITSLTNWRTEILAYFSMPFTNGVTEMINGFINRVHDAGRGYTFDVLRAKLLFGTKATKPAKFKYITHLLDYQGVGFALPIREEKTC